MNAVAPKLIPLPLRIGLLAAEPRSITRGLDAGHDRAQKAADKGLRQNWPHSGAEADQSDQSRRTLSSAAGARAFEPSLGCRLAARVDSVGGSVEPFALES